MDIDMSKHSLVEIKYKNAYWYICEKCGLNYMYTSEDQKPSLREALDSTDCDKHTKMSQSHNWKTSQGGMHYKALFTCTDCTYTSEQDISVSIPYVRKPCVNND